MFLLKQYLGQKTKNINLFNFIFKDKMFNSFIVRLDDACPGMDYLKWEIIEKILDKYSIKPLVAVIPQDQYFASGEYDSLFWNRVKKWQNKSWEIAIHGFNHKVSEILEPENNYIFFAKKTEFSNLDFQLQCEKIKQAKEIFKKNNIESRVFVSPNHGFNNITIEALRSTSNIRIISDGISIRPYFDKSFLFIPLLDWKFKKYVIGLRTVCIHPSTMTSNEISQFENECSRFRKKIISVEDMLLQKISHKGIVELLSVKFYKVYFGIKNRIYKLVK